MVTWSVHAQQTRTPTYGRNERAKDLFCGDPSPASWRAISDRTLLRQSEKSRMPFIRSDKFLGLWPSSTEDLRLCGFVSLVPWGISLTAPWTLWATCRTSTPDRQWQRTVPPMMTAALAAVPFPCRAAPTRPRPGTITTRSLGEKMRWSFSNRK